MKPVRKTNAQLAAELEHLRGLHSALRVERDAAVVGGKDLRTKLDEVKERLAAAETENNRMRGYLDRVMEDDHEREQLVTIGEPGGEQQLVPKRKHRPQPHCFAPTLEVGCDMGAYEVAGSAHEKRRHWVTY